MVQKRLRGAALGAAMAVGLAIGSPAWAAPDAWVTTKVKMALLTADQVNATDINVDTIDGHVTLHGTVPTEAEKTRAEQAARSVEGVTELRNMLAVVPPSRQERVEAADDQIKEKIEAALAADRALRDSSITVASVNNGVVVLRGDAASLSDHLDAVADARAVNGVKQVASEIKSPDVLSDAEIWRDTKPAAGDTPETFSVVMSDMWITSAAKVRLIANEQTPATSINVDTRDGMVTLFGTVPNAAAKGAAETEVMKVSGVKKVRNELQVVAPAQKEAVAAKDSEIETRVEQRMKQAVSDDADIDVEVKDGVVRLKGEVPQQTERLRVLTLARGTEGVRAVIDELQVRAQ